MMSEWEFLDDFEDVGPLPQDDEIQSLQRACMKNPEDLAPLLIYADYLGERDFLRSERRIRLLVEYCLILGCMPFSTNMWSFRQILDGDTGLDVAFDYMFAFGEKWLAHKPQYMDWKPRLIKTPEFISPNGMHYISVKLDPLQVHSLIIHRHYDKRAEPSYTDGYTNYGRERLEKGSEYICLVKNDMTYYWFDQWIKYRREGILVDNSNIVKFSFTSLNIGYVGELPLTLSTTNT